MAKTDGNSVAFEHPAYVKMKKWWDLPVALRSGSQAMRDAGTLYLPKNEDEKKDKYIRRLSRSHLYMAYDETISKLASMPFVRPVEVMEFDKLNEDLQLMINDIDKEGTSLSVFANKWLDTGIDRGLVHVLVDSPSLESAISIKTKEDLGIRPIAKVIDPYDVIGWQSEKNASGEELLTEFRYRETRYVSDGIYGSAEAEFIWVYRASDWQLWQVVDNKDRLVAEGINELGYIPIQTSYFNKTGFMQGKPLFYRLAELNLEHWQSASDQSNALRFARIPKMLALGFQEDYIFSIGADSVINPGAAPQDADFRVVEGNGIAIGAGEKDLERIQDEMVVFGLQPFITKTGNTTATEHSINDKGTDSDAQSWVRKLENGLQQVFVIAADWINVELPEGFGIDVFNDFSVLSLNVEEINAINSVRLSGGMSLDTALHEMKRRGFISQHIKIDDEVARIQSETPVLSMFGEPDNDDG